MVVSVETVKKFAPLVRLHDCEPYLPCSIEHMIANGRLIDVSPNQVDGHHTSVPAVTLFNGRLWMAYSGEGDDKTDIYVTSSGDGLVWDDGVGIGQQAVQPALVAFNNKLWMVYAGTGRDLTQIYVTSSSDGISWTNTHQIGQQTYVPAIASFKGKLWMVYTDSGSSQVYVTCSSDGDNWEHAWKIDHRTSVPALAVLNDKLWMVYTGSNSSDIYVTSSADGRSWNAAKKIGGQFTSVPALTAFKGKLWMVYTSPHSSDTYITSSGDGLSWSNAVQIPIQTSVPALAALGDHLCLSYTEANSSQLWASRSNDGITWHRPDITNLSQADLANYSDGSYYLQIAESQFAGEGLNAPVYYAVQEGPGYIELIYVFLFAFNGSQTVRLYSDKYLVLRTYADHPGDLECVRVRLTSDASSVTQVTFEAHGNKDVSFPSELEFVGSRVKVHCSLNAHGTFNLKKHGSWVEDENYKVVSFGDALGDRGLDAPLSQKIWNPSEYRPVGLDANGNPIGNQVWAKFAGRLGQRSENSLRDGRYFDGKGLSDETWGTVKALDWAASLTVKKDTLGKGPEGLGRRDYMAPRGDGFQNGLRLRDSSTGKYFVVMDDCLRWIPNPVTFNNLFFNWDAASINAGNYPVGPQISDGAYLAKSDADNRVYLVIDGSKRWIASPEIFVWHGFDWTKVRTVTSAQLAAMPNGTNIGPLVYVTDGTRVRDSSTGAIYLALDGALRHIPDPVVYERLFRAWSGWSNEPNVQAYKVSKPLTVGASLANGAPDNKVYLLVDGVKRWVSSSAVFDQFGFAWPAIQKLTVEQLNAIPTGATLY